jgi:GTPase
MKWRLQEGLGEAIYAIGVGDDGSCVGLNQDDLEKSLQTLKRMADRLGASVTTLRDRIVTTTPTTSAEKQQQRKTVEMLVRKVPDCLININIRIAVAGNCEAGKSTLISVLTHEELDNGQGRARLNLLRHIHEIQTGHTSSISNEIMGFNNSNEVQNFGNCRSVEEICQNSSKIITFIDLAGSPKYMKTAVFGLTGYAPDFTMLVLNANNAIAGTAKEHLGFSMALEVRVFIVINKVDCCSDEMLEQTVGKIEFLLKSPGCGKVPLRIKSLDDAMLAAHSFVEPKICPIFLVSCVEGSNLDKLKKFLTLLPPLMDKKQQEHELQQLPVFRADEIYFKKRVGNILAGMLTKGTIQEHEKLLLGPMDDGQFVPVQVQTVQRYRVACRIVRAGQSAALSIGNSPQINGKLRRGMVLLSEKLAPKACWQFEADIYLLFHAKHISEGFQATMHVDNVCQTAQISFMSCAQLKTNQRAKVIWRFKSRPEFLTKGSRLIFREGETKGMGEVVRVIYQEEEEEDDDELGEGAKAKVAKHLLPDLVTSSPLTVKSKSSTRLSPETKSKRKKPQETRTVICNNNNNQEK